MTTICLPEIEPIHPAAAERHDLWGALRAHGRGLLAYGALVDGWPAHIADHGRGYTPYGLQSNVAVMLESPVCEPKLRATLTRNWIRDMRNRGHRPVGVHLDRELAEVFAGEGFHVNPLGVVTDLQLREFDFSLPGRKFTQLRRWRNTAHNRGVVVQEITSDEELHGWLGECAPNWPFRQGLGREFAFMIRRSGAMLAPHARVFVASRNREPVAVVAFDPFYRNHRLDGYYLSLNRRATTAPNGTSDLVVLRAMQQFRDEGVRTVSLGLSPLRRLHDPHGPNTPTYGALLRMARHIGRRIYHFDNVGFHKSKYNGSETTAYGASCTAIPVRELLALMKLCRIV